MLRITTEGAAQLKRELSDIERRQLPFATALALSRTAQMVKGAEIEEMKRVFDAPTRFTLNSLFVRPAKKNRLEAVVWVKDYASKADAPTRWLLPEVMGGERGNKRSEKLLRARGILSAGRYLMPGRDMPLDGSGNVSRGRMQKVLSGLGAQGDRYANSTTSRRSIKNKRRFFVLGRGASALGIAERTGKKGSGAFKLLLAFGGAPVYRDRFDFFGVADRITRQSLPGQMQKAMDEAILGAK